MRGRWLLVAALLALVSALSSSARADEPTAEPIDAAARAEELIREGVVLRKEGREAEAFERFREAHAIHPSARARGQMGLAAKSIRRYVEAERYLAEALAAADDPWVQENREALELALAIVAKQLASLVVRSNVEGAELLVNGAVVGTLPLAAPVRVPAGAAQILVRAPRHEAASAEATLPAGEITELSLELTPLQPDPPSEPPPAGPTPDGPRPRPRAAPRAEPPPEEGIEWRTWLYVTGGVVGAVGVGLGTYFGIRTLMVKDDRNELCPDVQCSTDEGVQLDEEARTAATLSTLSFAAGASGIAAAVVVWLTDTSSPPSSARIWVTPLGGGVGLTYAF